MRQEDHIKTLMVRCNCMSCSHILRLDYWGWDDPDEPNEVSFYFANEPWRNFFARLVEGLKHIFFGESLIYHDVVLTVGSRDWAALVEFVNQVNETETQ